MQVIASVTLHSSLFTLAVMGRNASIQTLKHHCLQTLLTALRSVIMCVDWQGLYHGEERPPLSRSNLSRRASRASTTSCLMFEESSLDLYDLHPGPKLKRIQLLDVIIWPLSHLPRPPSALGSLSSPTASQFGQYPSPSASWRDASSVLDPLLGELIFRIASRLMRSCLLPIERSRVVDSVSVVSLRFIHRSWPLGSSRCTI